MAISLKQTAKLGAWLLVAAAVASAPVTVSAAANSANSVVNATVNSVISITSATPIGFSITPTAGGVVTSASDTVTVNSNNTAGYNLTLADSDATTTLASGGNSLTAHAGTKAAPTALANGTWGWAIENDAPGGSGLTAFDAAYTTETNNASSTSKWAGMPATGSPATVKSTSAVATADTTTVWYAAKATSTQPNGVYTGTVTYTATTN